MSADGSLHGLNAGHEPPILLRAGGSVCEIFTGGGPALGMIPDETYTAHEPIALESGDVFVIYTDGLTEARAPGDPDNLFGEEGRELSLIRDSLGEFPLVGFFGNGEISNNRLYSYTGVLALFL